LISQGVHPLWGVKQVRGGETRYFRAKCGIITRQMAMSALHYFKQVVNLSAICFHVESIGAIFGMLSRRAGLSASARLSCFVIIICILMKYSILTANTAVVKSINPRVVK